jgi:hypothetical protein
MKAISFFCLCGLAAAAEGTPNPKHEEARELRAGAKMVLDGFPEIPEARGDTVFHSLRHFEIAARDAGVHSVRAGVHLAGLTPAYPASGRCSIVN